MNLLLGVRNVTYGKCLRCRVFVVRTLCDKWKSIKITQKIGNKINHEFTFEEKTSIIKKRKGSVTSDPWNHIVNSAKAYLLPNGYDSGSTNVGYMRYVSLQALAFVFGTTSSVLSMQCLLYAMGLGENALPLAATLNWVIKDGFGQFGGVIFAGLVNNQYDSDPKRWRMMSSVAMEVSNGVEMITPLVPGFFLPMASIANIGKNISFLSASASRAAIHNSFALKENLADITAKSGSQTILSSLLGTSVGVFISSQVGDDYSLALMVFNICSSMNILLSYLSLKDVNIHALSVNHFDYLFYRYRNVTPDQVMNTVEFKANEFLLGAPATFFVPVRIGVSVDEAIVSSSEADETNRLFAGEKFIVTARTHKSKKFVAEVSLLFLDSAEESDILKGLAVAHVCRHSLHQQVQNEIGSSTATIGYYAAHNRMRSTFVTAKTRADDMTFCQNIVTESLSQIQSDDAVTKFTTKCGEQNWIISTLLLEKTNSRISFNI